jgi:uncharacterized protein YciI
VFVISSAYARPLDDKELIAEHIAFVEARYQDGTFIASGPRPSFVGGVIVAHGDDETALRAVMAQDPFIREGVVSDYDYLEFRASKASHPDLVEG